ncbi:MAG: Wzz/FepE/Etk N-terminal domain-containing protein [Candidatus Acidiferrales bacterium]
MSEQNYRNAPGNATREATLRDILTPLFRRRRLLLLSFSGVFLGAIIAALVLSSRYEAQMEILVNRDRMDPVVTTEQFSQTAPAAPALTEEEINSEVELLQSQDLLERVVLANKLQDKEKESIWAKLMPKRDELTYVSEAVKHLGKKLKVDAVKKTNMIEVSYQSSDPQIAYGVLNTLAAVYLEKHVTVHRPVGSYEFFAKETDKYQKALQESEVRLANFGREEGVAAPDVVRTDLAQQVATSIGALHQAQQAISADEQKIHDEEAQLKVTPARSTTMEVSNAADILLQQLQANLLAAQLKRTQLAMKYDSSYPLVQEADQEIAETQAAIAQAQKTQYMNQTTDRDPTYEYLREDVAKTKADLASQRATSAAVGRSIDSMKVQLVDLDQKVVKQADLIRETKANEANYLLYLSKREQEKTSDALDLKRIANVAIAVPPSVPVLPAYSPMLVLLIGLLLGLFVSVGAAFVAEYLDPSFRTPAEVNDVLKITVLASMPKKVA